MSTLSGRLEADNVSSISRLLHAARRSRNAHERLRLLREARITLDHARVFYAGQAEQLILEFAERLRVLLAPTRVALDVVEAELTALEESSP